jgi:hypothetical protein
MPPRLPLPQTIRYNAHGHEHTTLSHLHGRKETETSVGSGFVPLSFPSLHPHFLSTHFPPFIVILVPFIISISFGFFVPASIIISHTLIK